MNAAFDRTHEKLARACFAMAKVHVGLDPGALDRILPPLIELYGMETVQYAVRVSASILREEAAAISEEAAALSAFQVIKNASGGFR